MRVIVCGGREYQDWARVMETMDALNVEYKITTVAHGCATGADTLADHWARIRQKHTMRFPANWLAHGKGAGPRRNQKMLEETQPGLIVAFPGGKGTADMVSRGKAAGIEVVEVAP